MNKYIGTDFNDFLAEENMLGKVEAEAMKRVISFAIQKYIDENNIKKSYFAKKKSVLADHS